MDEPSEDLSVFDMLHPSFQESKGVYPISCVQVVEVLGDDGKLKLVWGYDDGTSAWKALGMVETMLNDMKSALSMYD